ncbi:GNAT family N-acetyltransferase [Acetobacteraceae bacterium KSS8]|uniref:GNAT family N-acetyltransferase n=1 Tax=Endosaccharibacter trunci TaxID=2812733 RepID=A0ABT1W4R1_9PROT|nr:GNAT family N-acetyltransferase [Acetobacteraceae bacterium KSS8]
MGMTVRDATEADLPAIVAITNHEIRTGLALWNDTPVTLENRAAWLAERRAAGYPVLVAETEGKVAGFGSYGPFRPQEGYRHTVEHSVYVDQAFRRRGFGDALLAALVAHAGASGMHAMVGAVGAANAGSIALHLRHGFAATASLPQVGRKFDLWHDLVFMHRLLG